MGSITLITGGARSGKSSYAQRLALERSDRPVYLATSRVWDQEHRLRIERHRADRGPQWETVEEPKNLSRRDFRGRTVVVDCVTLWCTNFFYDFDSDVDRALDAVKSEFDRLAAQDADFIFVTNEIGLGGVSTDPLQRRFTDLQGWVNQYIAQRAGGHGRGRGARGLSGGRPHHHPGLGDGAFRRHRQKIDGLTKPLGSLGRLEELALQIGWIQQTLTPSLDRPYNIVFAGDHGVAEEKVSLSPKEVTRQMVDNFLKGGAGISFLCRQHGFRLRVVDAGVDAELPAADGLIDLKIRRGTRNFVDTAAMTREEMELAVERGASVAAMCRDDGCNVISFGEMGIGNTSASSMWMTCLTGTPLEQCVGAGSGLGSAGVRRKCHVLRQALDGYAGDRSVEDVMRWFGGYEMVMAVGAMLQAAELGMVILVDGFIMTNCMLAASKLYPEVLNYAVFAHRGDESGHALLLDAMGAKPLLDLGLRLGEGTGAVCAYPIVESAVRMLAEMASFGDAGVTKYF